MSTNMARKKQIKTNKKKAKRRPRIRIFRLIIVVFILLGMLSLGGNLYYKSASKPVNPNSTATKIVDIPAGANVKQIATILKDQDMIKNKKVFVANVKETGKAEQIKSGKYKLSQSMSNDQIIDKMIKGQIYQDGIKVTIPEGSISTEIVNILVKKNLGDRKKLVKLFRTPSEFSSKYSFLKDSRITTLEGFLYPETYYFKKGISEKDIFDKMLSEFDKNYKKSISANVKKNNYNFYDTIIMASIIEKEAVKDEDRPIIASVFYNRLAKKMKLQSDAVLQYGLPERKGKVLYSDLKVESAYNLYIHNGLPPTPIASPGIKSMIAASRPSKTDYLYFVTNVNGVNSYSKTFEEHDKNAKNYHKERDAKEKADQEKSSATDKTGTSSSTDEKTSTSSDKSKTN